MFFSGNFDYDSVDLCTFSHHKPEHAISMLTNNRIQCNNVTINNQIRLCSHFVVVIAETEAKLTSKQAILN